jgi:hypothetical protein
MAQKYLAAREKKELLYHKSILSTFVFNRFCDIKFSSARKVFHESHIFFRPTEHFWRSNSGAT